jgi:polyphosphate kinase
VCALKPGVPGISENIRVRSILGRFLEHSRVFYFWNGGAEDVYLASADWMDRNFFRRIEVCFPVLDPDIRKRVVHEGLKVHLAAADNAWEMQSDGTYQRKRGARGKSHQSQSQLLAELTLGAARS